MRYFAASASLAPATFNTRRKELKSSLRWALSEGIIAEDPIAGTRARREDDVPRAVEEDAIRRLLAPPDKTTFVGLREESHFRVVIRNVVLCFVGRRGEACSCG